MINLGLVGKNISKSKSKQMYEKLLGKEVNYQLFDYSSSKEIPSLDDLFNKVDGLSITAPFKIHFLKDVQIDNEIKLLGAINCIKKVDNNYFGTNTDYLACKDILLRYFDFGYKFFLLGDGAMSRVISTILKDNKQEFVILSRRDKNLNNFNFCKEETKYIIINTCHKSYVFDGFIDNGLVAYWDLNYSVEISKESPLFKNDKYLDGLELLFLQAKYALEFWKINIS